MPRVPAQKSREGAEGVHVALLRGINVGGRHKLPMKDLSAMFEEAGGHDVQTYIQSGNVVFRATAACAAALATTVAGAIVERFGFQAPVILRTAQEVRDVVRGNPFLRTRADTDALHVLFLEGRPRSAQIASLDPERSPPDTFEVRGQEVFLRCPNGVARTRLTNAYFDTKLATTSTARNWRTVLRLLEMTAAA